jgi:hypothetical protein
MAYWPLYEAMPESASEPNGLVEKHGGSWHFCHVWGGIPQKKMAWQALSNQLCLNC